MPWMCLRLTTTRRRWRRAATFLIDQNVGNAVTGIAADVGYSACDNLIKPVGDKQKLIPNRCKYSEA